ncbi:Acetyltransferase (GNAT) family protein [Actinopolymorpha cephalotaxi]|uniref:Acetyltransferase (GNAT) family protein n=1 Tax=Actinopolymorpha cephalotaxi TaxID=504797 RepID=A0A1I2ZKY4_9ACTN|nr:GNAT family N-acetyltransferase [Actinopolymorpha cephalotaxi]NYH82049.1 ribosomal protein S18 acetylase RimI-like enzyme [Actinopolymorpha cephalotaxi]SFH38315.1 Acetyltransferase (GNAT) family protein [Actinopolymorpha cephalotaxi]
MALRDGEVGFRVADSRVAAAVTLVYERATARRLGAVEPVVADRRLVEVLRARLDAPRTVVVVGERGAETVACCFGSPARSADNVPSEVEAHVSLVAVAPPYWGLGYGRAVLDFAERALAAAGYRSAQLHVQAANGRARGLYERCGWTLLGPGGPHKDGPQVVYGKHLGDGDIPADVAQPESSAESDAESSSESSPGAGGRVG